MNKAIPRQIQNILNQRVMVMDGAMGTSIQDLRLGEQDYRGDRFQDHSRPLKGNNELLTLTKPDVITDIHLSYLREGADIIETNTLSLIHI